MTKESVHEATATTTAPPPPTTTTSVSVPRVNNEIIGFPTPLLRKVQLVTEGPDRLPVYTLTFAIPDISSSSPSSSSSFNSTMVKSYHDLRLDLGDVVKMVIPNYKPKSYSVSALRATEFDVTYKLYPNGRASGFLHQLVPQPPEQPQPQQHATTTTTTTTPHTMIHSFVKKHSSRRRNPGGTHIAIIAYGVGITEGLPVARAELLLFPAERVILIWCVRRMADTFWSEEIQELRQLYPQQFQMVYIISREQPPPPLSLSSSLLPPIVEGDRPDTLTNLRIFYGQRISVPLLQDILESYVPHKETVRFLSVGTKEMMAMTDDMLVSMKYSLPYHSLLPKV